MKLRPLGSNKTEVEFVDGTTVFFSYETPVALQDADGNYFKTEDFWSVTTSKHINQWLKSRGADYCDTLTQDSINARALALLLPDESSANYLASYECNFHYFLDGSFSFV